MSQIEERQAFPVAAIRAAEAPVIEAEPTDAVMRRAAWAVAAKARSLLRSGAPSSRSGLQLGTYHRGGVYGSAVLGLIGAGDNGGDALYALAELGSSGVRTHALLLAPERAHRRALRAFHRTGGRSYETPAGEHITSLLEQLSPDLVLDGIVGLGASGPPRPPAAAAATFLRSCATPVIAVDLPSGVDPDTGQIHEDALPARATVTFGLWRRAHLLAPQICGELVCAPIGIPRPDAKSAAPSTVLSSLGERAAAEIWPIPTAQDTKYTQGVVAIRAGSARFPGAAVLCTGAAVAATSGMVRYIGACSAAVLAARPEIVAHPDLDSCGRAQAWVVGPGAGTDAAAVTELAEILAKDLPTVIDADALRVLAAHPAILRRRSAPVVLTPHLDEFAALAQTFAPEVARNQLWETDRVGAVRALVTALATRGIPATVLCKGRITVIDDGEHSYAQDAGGSWAATAGSGDVLAGLVGALLAAHAGGALPEGCAVPRAVAAAQVVHSAAARIAATRHGAVGVPIGASDLLQAVPAAICEVRAVAQ